MARCRLCDALVFGTGNVLCYQCRDYYKAHTPEEQWEVVGGEGLE